jgi:hypothetical protein
MLGVLAVAAAIGALLLVAMATGRLDYLQSQLTAIRKPFNDVSAALTGPVQRGRAWDVVVKEANPICTRYEHEEPVVKPALPRKRRAYVRAIRIELERERVTQAELAKLQPPPDYRGPHSQFLSNRQLALAALEPLQKATKKKKNREEYVVAARDLALRKSLVDHYAPAAGMPACAF